MNHTMNLRSECIKKLLHDRSIVLAGFIIGSLVKVWPWSNAEALQQVDATGSMHIGGAVAFALIGFCLVTGIEIAGKMMKK